MKKTFASLCTVLISTALFFICLTPEAGAQNIQGKMGIGIRGGAAFLTQDIAEVTEGETGPIISGNIFYGLTDTVSLGLIVEWERHKVEDTTPGFPAFNLGDETTISLLPTVELRAAGLGAFSPYGSFGIGLNINSFNESSELAAFCAPVTCTIEPENTFALKVSGGADYFVTPNLALNAEIGWKLNSGDADVIVCFLGFCDAATVDNKVSVLTTLFGLRYYF